jgi:hypothetical protein
LESSLLIFSCHTLLRDAPTDAILDENAAINLPFVDVAFVIPTIHHGHSLRCLLRHPELELPTAAVVLGERPSDGLERVTSAENQTWSVVQPESIWTNIILVIQDLPKILV